MYDTDIFAERALPEVEEIVGGNDDWIRLVRVPSSLIEVRGLSVEFDLYLSDDDLNFMMGFIGATIDKDPSYREPTVSWYKTKKELDAAWKELKAEWESD